MILIWLIEIATRVAASSEVRQAYKQFIGAVVELLNGEVVSEELHEVAQTVYALFGGDATEYDATQKAFVKR
jgi:activating signal cointegrator complex subunit 3